LIILLWGFFMFAQQAGLIAQSLVPSLWIIVVIVVGILLIAGAVYRMGRPRTSPTY
jgi:hypothetical protein